MRVSGQVVAGCVRDLVVAGRVSGQVIVGSMKRRDVSGCISDKFSQDAYEDV